ncbi:MAG TPA: hypothetical protein PLD88_09865, partial [Candidatus Berkiella sp.]|nr:hypothetical protein [Candidatus Berkiella sp.]
MNELTMENYEQPNPNFRLDEILATLQANQIVQPSLPHNSDSNTDSMQTFLNMAQQLCTKLRTVNQNILTSFVNTPADLPNQPAVVSQIIDKARQGEFSQQTADHIATLHEAKCIESLLGNNHFTIQQNFYASDLSYYLFDNNLFSAELRRKTIADLLNEPKWLEIGKKAFN